LMTHPTDAYLFPGISGILNLKSSSPARRMLGPVTNSE
jgi:hypothetical protein